MRVDVSEVEFACDQEEDGSHGVKADEAARLAFGSLKQAVDGLDKAIGLTGLGSGDDPVKVIANHARDIFHGLHFGAHHIGTPLPQHGRYDMGLFAIEYVSQLLAIQPGAGGTLSLIHI